MRVTQHSPPPVNSRPTPWPRSPNRLSRVSNRFPNRTSMYRVILFLVLIALAGAGAAWVADQPGEVLLKWDGGQAHPSLPVFALLLGIVVVAAILAWTILLALWRMPERVRRGRREK